MPRRLIHLPVPDRAAAVMMPEPGRGARAAMTTETEVVDRVATRCAHETGAGLWPGVAS
ncbi:MAG: hypothetical protein ACU0AX_01265 [Roseovarius sp.]|uniref:hypothetical protein n=1 Tax=Roseovarius sp. TaxID=1486281 RepID=UPI00405837CF